LVKINSGKFKGHLIKTPSGLLTRPTSNKIRKALFSILNSKVLEAKTADLFAGSGALGIEALSRGAISCLFIDNVPATLKIIQQNITTLNLIENSLILKSNLNALITSNNLLVKQKPFDLIIADPPYNKDFTRTTIKLVAHYKLLSPKGTLIIEHSPQEKLIVPSNLQISDHRTYNKTKLSFLEHI